MPTMRIGSFILRRRRSALRRRLPPPGGTPSLTAPVASATPTTTSATPPSVSGEGTSPSIGMASTRRHRRRQGGDQRRARGAEDAHRRAVAGERHDAGEHALRQHLAGKHARPRGKQRRGALHQREGHKQDRRPGGDDAGGRKRRQAAAVIGVRVDRPQRRAGDEQPAAERHGPAPPPRRRSRPWRSPPGRSRRAGRGRSARDRSRPRTGRRRAAWCRRGARRFRRRWHSACPSPPARSKGAPAPATIMRHQMHGHAARQQAEPPPEGRQHHCRNGETDDAEPGGGQMHGRRLARGDDPQRPDEHGDEPPRSRRSPSAVAVRLSDRCARCAWPCLQR